MQEPNENQRNGISETASDVGEVAAEFGLDVAIEMVLDGAATVADGALGIAGEAAGSILDAV